MNEALYDCEVVRDLLPAYAGQSAGAKSSAMVEAHLRTCPTCRAELESLRENDVHALQIGREVLEKFNKKHSKKYKRAVLRAVLISLASVVAAAALLFAVRVPVTLDLDDMELNSGFYFDDVDNKTVGMLDFSMKYNRRPWAKQVGELTSRHYDDATSTLTEATFYNISPRLVDILLSPFIPSGHSLWGYPDRSDAYSLDIPLVQGEDGQMQSKYPNVVWKVYYYQHRDEDIMTRTLFPKGHDGPRQSLLDSKGNLKPEIAEVVTLLWEGPVDVAESRP